MSLVRKGQYGLVYDLKYTFGLACDGITDDTAAFNNAIIAMNNSGGGTLTWTGVIKTVGSILWSSNVSLVGKGAGVSIIAPSGTGFTAISANTTGITSANPYHDITFRDFEINCSNLGNSSESYQPSEMGIRMPYLLRVNFENIYIHNAPATGMRIGFLQDCHLTNVRAHNNGRLYGVNGTSTSYGMGSGISIATGDTMAESFTISNCKANNNAGYGIDIENVNGYYVNNVSISNCFANNNGMGGIHDNGIDGIVIDTCIVNNNTGSGVVIDNGSFNGSITNVKARNNTVYGVYFNGGGSQYNVKASQVFNNQSSGIRTLGSIAHLTIEDVDSFNNGQAGGHDSNGMYFDGTLTNLRVVTNKCYDQQSNRTQQYGVGIYGTLIDSNIMNNDLMHGLGSVYIDPGATIINSIIDDNAGYNNLNSITNVQPAPSPWVYTAGSSKETLMLQGTSISVANNMRDNSTFPKIACLYGYSHDNQAKAYQRYDTLVAGSPTSSPTLRKYNPNFTNWYYKIGIQVDFTTWNAANNTYSGIYVYQPWLLTLVGSTLSAAVDNQSTTTAIPVTSTTPFSNYFSSGVTYILCGTEVMQIQSIDSTNNILHVTRATYSNISSHNSGDRIAPLASDWPNSWMLNITPYCPTDPSTGKQWMDVIIQKIVSDYDPHYFNGIFWDSIQPSQNGLFNGNIDADNDNVADGANGASGTGWRDGAWNMISRTKAAIPNVMVMGNSYAYLGQLDGIYREIYDTSVSNFHDGFAFYKSFDDYQILNPDTNNNGYSINYQQLRFGLATALLANGYFAYDNGAQNHGQSWWFDEYDNGAGSSVITSMNTTTKSVVLYSGTGTKFRVGDVIMSPGTDINDHNDEEMLVTAINGDTLTVQRGFNGSTVRNHAVGAKVYTESQMKAGLGWLGNPTGDATSSVPFNSAANMLTNGTFASGTSGWSVVGSGTLSVDTTNYYDSTQSGHYVVTAANAKSNWAVGLQQKINVASGTTYTVAFNAKSSVTRPMQILAQQSSSPFTMYQQPKVVVGTTWQRYAFSFTSTSAAQIKIEFALGDVVSDVWFDNVQVMVGDCNLWTRQFDNGMVVVNGTSNTQTVSIPSGYRYIKGTQNPTVNTGAVVSPSVSVNSGDCLILVKDHTTSTSTSFTSANIDLSPNESVIVSYNTLTSAKVKR